MPEASNNAYFYNTKESEDELLKRGIKQLELNVWKDAAETFRQMTKLYPENYKGWLGMCIVDANDDENLYDTENLRNNVIVQCPQNMVDPLFGARVRSEKRVSELMDEIQDYNEKINYDQRQVESLKNELIEIKEEKDHLSVLIVLALVFFLGTFIAGSANWHMGLVIFCVDMFIVYLIFRNRMVDNNGNSKDIQKEMESIKEKIWRYKEQIEENTENLNELQNRFNEEESCKGSKYFIEIMKY